MFDGVLSGLILAVLCAGAWGGRIVLGRLPEAHRDRDTLDFARAASGLLITFTALVLGLLLNTVSSDFKKTEADLRTYGGMITQLDGELRAYGPEADGARELLRRYTASAIASTWPGEPPPSGDLSRVAGHAAEIDSPVLGDMLQEVETLVRRLKPATPEAQSAQAVALARMTALLDQRWSLIGEARTSLSPPLLGILLVWLVFIFVGFGMTAPPNASAATAIGMVAVSVAAAFFVLLELDGPLDGVIQVPSEPLRHALLHLSSRP